MATSKYVHREKQVRTMFGYEDEMHLVLVEKIIITLDGTVTCNDKYVEVYNPDGKYVMKLDLSDAAYLGGLCNFIKNSLYATDETKE